LEIFVSRTIHLELNSIRNIIPSFRSLDRKTQIQELKQAIYQYRNQRLSVILEKEIDQHCFKETEFGKPYLSDYPKFNFNHSHSQEYYALAHSRNIRDLGVDIEDTGRKVRFDALAQHAFHPEEYQTWQESDYDPNFGLKSGLQKRRF